MLGSTLAHQTFEALAPSYDVLTADEDYDDWLRAIEGLALAHGLPGRRVLDVACGTGRTAEPLVGRGYDVSACDLSPAMVRQAERRLARAGARANVAVADMRDLPDWGPFDLITCLNDALNYLLHEDELDAAFASVARSLRPGGLYVFDVTSRSSYGNLAADPTILDAQDVELTLQGRPCADARPNVVCTWRTHAPSGAVITHTQRHWPLDLIRERLERARLRCITVLGQQGRVMHANPDEARHRKLAFVARRETADPRRRMEER